MATVRVQLRRGTEQQWYDANPVLAAGEVGIETDTNTFKFGDGTTAWRVLDYALSDTVDDYIPLSTKAVANGVASLDSNGFVPTSQLPPLAKVTVSAVANTAARLALTAEAGDIAIEADSGQSYVLSASPASTDANWKALVGSEAVADLANAALVASTGLSKTYDDGAGTITFSATSAIETAAADATSKVAAEAALRVSGDAASVSTASADVTSKVAAEAALRVSGDAASVSTAASDATSKVAAEAALRVSGNSASVATAAADATAKANAAQAAAEATAAAAAATHEADTTSVHGIADTSLIVTTTATQTLAAKSLTSPNLTGTPIAPTANAGTDTTQIATTAFVQDAIELVVGAAPAALNTLAEIATSLADNADLSGSLTTSISNKVAKAGDTMSGALNMGTYKITSLGVPTAGTDASTKAYADGLMTNSIATHGAVTTGIHGISDAANLVYTADTRLSDLRVPQDSSVSTAKIVDLNVTSAKINDSAVTAAKIASDAVTTAKILDLNVTATKLAASAVETAKIADDAVTAAKIAESAVGTSEIANDAVTAAKIAADAVSTSEIADGSITTAKIVDDAVTAAKIATGAVGTLEIADDAVTAAKIAESAVGTSEIANDAVTAAKIAADAVSTSEIADDAVTAAKIATGAVGTSEIADTSITTAKINNSAITADKIESLAVTEGKLAAGAVTSGKIADGTIVNADINASAEIEKSKISGLDTALGLLAPLASPTFTGTVSGITKTMVGLGSADNTADTTKPVSTATQTALDLKLNSSTAASTYAPLASPTFTGVPVAPTAAVATNTTQVATTAYVRGEVAALVNSAGATLDTLGEIATALGNDANLSTTLTNAIALKAPLASPTFTGTNTVANITVTGTSNMSANGVQFSDGTQTKIAVPSLTTTTTTVSAAYNLSTVGLTLRDQLINIAGAYAITIPTNATTAFPIGTSIDFWQSSGAGGASFAAADGTVTIYSTPGSTLRALYSSATITKVGTNSWLLAGDLKA